jgi:hypothetical protein
LTNTFDEHPWQKELYLNENAEPYREEKCVPSVNGTKDVKAGESAESKQPGKVMLNSGGRITTIQD